MRTTVDLDKRLLARVKKKAEAEGLTLSQWLERAARSELDQRATPAPKPFRLVTAGQGGLSDGYTWHALDAQTSEPAGDR